MECGWLDLILTPGSLREGQGDRDVASTVRLLIEENTRLQRERGYERRVFTQGGRQRQLQAPMGH